MLKELIEGRLGIAIATNADTLAAGFKKLRRAFSH